MEKSNCCEPKAKPKKHFCLKLMLLVAGVASAIYLKSKMADCAQSDDECTCGCTSIPDSDSHGAFGAVGDDTPSVVAADPAVDMEDESI